MKNPTPPVPVSAESAARLNFALKIYCGATRRPLLALAALAALVVPGARAQSSFPATAVGSKSAAQTVTVPVTAAGSVQSVAYVTMGAANLDYASSGSGDNCTGKSFTAGQTCTVSAVFQPQVPGERNGALVLLGSGSTVLGTAYLSGVGQGPLAVPVPGSISIEAGQEGEWTQINNNQPATQADLYLPSGLALDGAGDLFIADSSHNMIREVLATGANKGNIVTVAGNGDAGYSPSVTIAINSPLNIPSGVAIDGAGNLYIADTNNNVVREVNLTLGTISTVAGNGQPGYSGDGGAATSAMLNSPKGVSVDASGNLYIADTGNNIIREVSGGKINTIAGTPQQTGNSGDGGLATSALLAAPQGVAFDTNGKMYIPDSGNNEVRVVSGGTINAFAGTGTAGYSGDNGAAISAQLDTPFGVATDPANNVYIADARNYVVRRVDSQSGTITTVAGNNTSSVYNDGKSGYTYGNGQSGEQFTGNGIAAGAPSGVTGAGIYAPYAVVVDASGDMLIAEYYDQIVREVNANQATLFFTPQAWVNQVSAPQTQEIQNIGNVPFTASSIQTDANAQYDAAAPNCSTVQTGVDDQCSVGAQFAPTAAGNPLVGNVTVTVPGPNPSIDIQAVGQALAQNQVNVTLASIPNPSNFGQPVTFTVTVAQAPGSTEGTPTGNVTFADTYNGNTGPIGTTQTLNNGVAKLTLSNLGVGTHQIVATYSGNTYYQTNTSNTLAQVVNEQVTVVLINSSGNNPSVFGASVTFQATVTVSGGIALNNVVNFYNGANFLGSGTPNAAGVATYTTAALPLGNNSITASYTDSNNVTGTSKALIQMVQQQTSTTLASSGSPSVYGSPVTFTAVVTAVGTVVPTGKVTFYNGTTSLGTGTLAASGASAATATLITSALPVGTDDITAVYGGDTDDFTSTSAVLQQVVNVANTTTTLTASANPSIAGKGVTLTATVAATTGTGIPTGTVNFMNGTALLGTGTLNAKGVATYVANLPVGTYSITAAYQGDSDDSPSTSAVLSLSIVQATTTTTLTASATSITPNTPVILTATVTGNGGTPTGTVTFMDGTTSIGTGTLNASGVATLTVSTLAVGQQSITAVYGGDADDAGSTSTAVIITVKAFSTTTVLAASATNLGSGQPLALVAVVASASGSAVTGTITFVSGGATLGTATLGANNSATLTLGNLAAGNYTITAQYSGDANDAASTSNSISVTVGPTSDFTVQVSPASLSIPSAQYGITTITLNSENGFTDTMAVGCSSLPFSVTCTFSSNDVTLAANGAATIQLTVDTNSPLVGGGQAKNEIPGLHGGLLAACLFPGTALFGFAFWRFRKRHGIFKVLAIVTMLVGTTFLMNGCGGLSLSSAKAGTYTIQVTATGEKSGISHLANLSVQVTQ
jgi:large repetitive protein